MYQGRRGIEIDDGNFWWVFAGEKGRNRRRRTGQRATCQRASPTVETEEKGRKLLRPKQRASRMTGLETMISEYNRTRDVDEESVESDSNHPGVCVIDQSGRSTATKGPGAGRAEGGGRGRADSVFVVVVQLGQGDGSIKSQTHRSSPFQKDEKATEQAGSSGVRDDLTTALR